MPHDFRSPGRRDEVARDAAQAAAGPTGSGHTGSGPSANSAMGNGGNRPIGFNELRLALEIAALREDLARLVQDSNGLRDRIEDAVEEVRGRFAAMTAEDLADSEAMAPLLRFAVESLLDLRDQARRLDTRTGSLSDDDRRAWAAAADAPRRGAAAAQAAPSGASSPPPPSSSLTAPSPPPPSAPPASVQMRVAPTSIAVPPADAATTAPPRTPMPPPPPASLAAAAAYPVPPSSFQQTPDPSDQPGQTTHAAAPASSWLAPSSNPFPEPTSPPAPPYPPPPAPPAFPKAVPQRSATPPATKTIDWLGPVRR